MGKEENKARLSYCAKMTHEGHEGEALLAAGFDSHKTRKKPRKQLFPKDSYFIFETAVHCFDFFFLETESLYICLAVLEFIHCIDQLGLKLTEPPPCLAWCLL